MKVLLRREKRYLKGTQTGYYHNTEPYNNPKNLDEYRYVMADDNTLDGR